MRSVVRFGYAVLLASAFSVHAYLDVAPLKAVLKSYGSNADRFDDFENHGMNMQTLLASDATNIVPILIMGQGAAGLGAALRCARGKTAAWLASGKDVGGQIVGSSEVENWPGVTKRSGLEIMEIFAEQATLFGTNFLDDTVTGVDLSRWPYRITTESGLVLNALSIIIATGASIRRLGVPGEHLYWGKGVGTCAICDGPFLPKNARVFVVGGGDAAGEVATEAAKHAAEVHILVRKKAMRANRSMQDRIRRTGNVQVRYNYEIVEILGDGKRVTGVKLVNNETGEITTEPAQAVFVTIGRMPNTQLFEGQIELTPSRHLEMITRTQHTSVPGVYGAGDVQDPRYKQAFIAAADATKAAHDAEEFLMICGWGREARDFLLAQGRLFQGPAN